MRRHKIFYPCVYQFQNCWKLELSINFSFVTLKLVTAGYPKKVKETVNLKECYVNLVLILFIRFHVNKYCFFFVHLRF